MACGPLSSSEYDSIIALSSDKKAPGKLTKCNIKLATDEESDGEVYIASKTQKLYLAVPVDARIFFGAESVA